MLVEDTALGIYLEETIIVFSLYNPAQHETEDGRSTGENIESLRAIKPVLHFACISRARTSAKLNEPIRLYDFVLGLSSVTRSKTECIFHLDQTRFQVLYSVRMKAFKAILLPLPTYCLCTRICCGFVSFADPL